MVELTLLTTEDCKAAGHAHQLYGTEPLEKRGMSTGATDLAVLLGVGRFYNGKFYGASYWTTASHPKDKKPIIVSESGEVQQFPEHSEYFQNNIGLRPVIEMKKLSKEDLEYIENNKVKAPDGIYEVDYGYYPQVAAPSDLQKKLEKLYRADEQVNDLRSTSDIYYLKSYRMEEITGKQLNRVVREYRYNGHNYVRVLAERQEFDGFKGREVSFTLARGDSYRYAEPVWVEVLPVKWLISEKYQKMYSAYIISGAMPYHDKEKYDGNFKKTELYKYLNDPFSRSMLKVKNRTEYRNRYEDMYFPDCEEDREKAERKEVEIKNLRKENKNPYKLNFEELDEIDIIKNAIKSNTAIFLHGKPGSGKSARVKQLDNDFIELNLSHLDPELLDGIAGEKNGKAIHIKPPWLEELEKKCKNEKDKLHILFLEELTNSSPIMQAKAFGIALEKKVAGRWNLPENARVVAAGNELEDSIATNEMVEPLYDRFAHINIETTAEKWLEWAATPDKIYSKIDYEKKEEPRAKIHPAIYAYISKYGDKVLSTPYNRENPEPHADPRRWEMASNMLYESNNPEALTAIIGKDLTKDFVNFCKQPVVSIEDVINGYYTDKDLKVNIGKGLMTVSSLLPVDSTNMPKIREFIKQMQGGDELCAKFDAQWSQGNEERLEQLQEIYLKESEEQER